MKGDAPMEENKLEKGALYVVGTPIGNLSDFSPRAAEKKQRFGMGNTVYNTQTIEF